jgi:hypothetical protein
MKKILIVFCILSSMGAARAQQPAAGSEKAVTFCIREEILFKNLTAKSESELLDKKIAAVDNAIKNPEEIFADEQLEKRRLNMYSALKYQLAARKNELAREQKNENK